MERVRVDRWLCAARLFRSRTQAHDACVGGLVQVNGTAVRPHHLVSVGDEVRAQAARLRVVEVRALADKRLGAAAARELYEDHSPPPPPRRERVAVRERGAGRPTKRERRDIDRLRRRP